LPTRLIAVSHPTLTAPELESRLRAGLPPVIARIEDDRVLLDLRTVFPEQDDEIVSALAALAA
jgi:L-seryl-tRNA(Ser) seleniumtransferase